MDGPIYLKSGVTLRGDFLYEGRYPTEVVLYDGPNTGSVAEEAMVVMDNVSDARVSFLDATSIMSANVPCCTGILDPP